jgi:hypothetical protein
MCSEDTTSRSTAVPHTIEFVLTSPTVRRQRLKQNVKRSTIANNISSPVSNLLRKLADNQTRPLLPLNPLTSRNPIKKKRMFSLFIFNLNVQSRIWMTPTLSPLKSPRLNWNFLHCQPPTLLCRAPLFFCKASWWTWRGSITNYRRRTKATWFC